MAKSLKLIVEALLFASNNPMTLKGIHECIPDAKGPDIKSALKVIKYEYEAMGRSFTLKEIGGGYQFRSRTEYGEYILRMLQVSPSKLSKAAMETLAIVAYKQPIIRQEIERLRGVDVGGILRTLLEKGLLRIMGRKNLPGNPLIYGTTKRFLEVFDLKNIEALPSMKEMKAFGAEDEKLEAPQGEGSIEEKQVEESPDPKQTGEPAQEEVEQAPEIVQQGSDNETKPLEAAEGESKGDSRDGTYEHGTD